MGYSPFSDIKEGSVEEGEVNHHSLDEQVAIWLCLFNNSLDRLVLPPCLIG